MPDQTAWNPDSGWHPRHESCHAAGCDVLARKCWTHQATNRLASLRVHVSNPYRARDLSDSEMEAFEADRDALARLANARKR